jgi:hypothetical protein
MTPSESLLRAIAVTVLARAHNPVAAVPTSELAAALHAFDASMQVGGDGLAPMVPEPADVVLRRAREAMGLASPVSALRPPNEPDEIERLRRALIRIRDKCDWERDFAVRVATEALER